MGAKKYEAKLAHGLLKSVSRSFYLTLRLLPAGLRGPVSLAYLLARAADSIADAAAVPAETRLELLDAFSGALVGGGVEGLHERLEGEVNPVLSHAGERRLLEALPDCLAWLAVLREHEVAAIRGVLERIVAGQRLDVERFPDMEYLRSLASRDDLEEYTYLVAGSVGEFWTELCVEELGAKCFDDDVETMKLRGVALGKGLQLVNILRDLAEDFGNGRCYLPEEELGGVDLLEGWLDRRPGKLTEIFEMWCRRCRTYLDEGIIYVEDIRKRRLRYGTALPVLLAVRTLVLLEEADWPARLRGVKVARGEVKWIMARAAAASMTAGGLRKMYRELGK